MWLELDHIKHPLPRAIRRSSPKSRKGLARVLPCNLLAWHHLCATYLSVISCHGWVGWGTKFFKPSSRRAMWGRGQVCLDLMSLTRPHGDETAGGSTQCWLGRCLVSLVLRLMAKYSPHDPRDVA